MKNIFLLCPTLIGIAGGELQYSSIDEADILGSIIGFSKDSQLELIQEIMSLLRDLDDNWEDFSMESNIYFSSSDDLSQWLFLFKRIIEGNMGKSV